MRRLAPVLGLALTAGACSGDEEIVVRLDVPDSGALGLQAADVERLRVRVIGDEQGARAEVEVTSSETRVDVVGLSTERFRVEVEGFDARGRSRAFGRSGRVDAEFDGREVRVRVRRSLAYAIHAPRAGTSAGRTLYALDPATRTIVERVALPGVPRSLRPWGGRAILLAMSVEGREVVGVMDTRDHALRTIGIEHPAEVVVAPAERGIAVAVGGGALSFVDLEAGQALAQPTSVGGTVLDAAADLSGRRALVVIDISPPGLIDVDLRARTAEALSVIQAPGGVSVDPATEVAYVVSRETGDVVAVSLASGRAVVQGGSLGGGGGLATYAVHQKGIIAVSEQGPRSTVRAYSTASQRGLAGEVTGFDGVVGVAADGPGRRVVIVARGGVGSEPGLGVGLTAPEAFPSVTFTHYPIDPVDGVRYRPSGLSTVYGD